MQARMEILEVQSARDWKLFLELPHLIYAGDPLWIAPLHRDIRAVFDATRNKVLEKGDYRCFILLDSDGTAVGRIAAFIDHQRNEEREHAGGGIGFFECIQKKEYAFALFQAAENYLKEQGMKFIDGPINFGSNDKFWGLHVRGQYQPLYQENYHPAYYRDFFEDWGFQPYEQILTFYGKLAEVPGDRFRSISERAKKRYGFHVRNLKDGDLDTFATHFAEIYNESFQHMPFFKPLTGDGMLKIFQQLRPIADPSMVGICYQEERPVGFIGLIPDINPFLKKANGKLNWWKILRFIVRLRTTKQKALKGIGFGIHPDFQKKGVFSVLVSDTYFHPDMAKYDGYYLATIRGHNTIMIKTILNLGVKMQREHLTFRKILVPEVPFNAFEFIAFE